MAAILQFRQGSKTSFITSGPYISEPFFDTDTNIIHIGVDGSSTITLTKLEDINSGSFSISGDFSGTNLSLSGDITASNANLSGDITIGGNIILGDQIQDTITVSGQFDSDLIPSESLQYSLGSLTKKWKHLYAESASIDSIDLVSNLPSGVISGSQQVVASLPTDTVSGSQQVIDFLPIGVVSGSSQILDGTNIVSSSQQVTDFLPSGVISGSIQILGGSSIVSSSQQVTEFLPSNVISGSDQVLGGTNIVSSSIQVINFLPNGSVSSSAQVLGGTNIVSSSSQINVLLPTGVVSQSNQVLGGTGILSSSDSSFNDFSASIHSTVKLNQDNIGSLNVLSHTHSNKLLLDTINQNLSTTSDVQFNDMEVDGTGSFSSNVTIYGDLTVFGTESIINATNLSIADNMIYLNSGSTVTNPDLGFAGNYNDGTYAHAGLFRDASDGVWKFYDGYTPEPEGSIDINDVSFTLGDLEVKSIDVSDTVTSTTYVGTGSLLVFPGTNIVSSSQQVIQFLPTNTISSSQQVIDFLPSGVVSGSNQVLGGTNIISSSIQVINFLPTGTLSGSDQVLGGTNIISSSQQVISNLPTDTISGSQQVIDFLPIGVVSGSGQLQDILPPNVISGSNQLTSSLDLRYLEINGDNVLSSSNETFFDYSQSVDIRLLDTLSSGSNVSSSLYDLVGNFPTSGSLGTSAFYNVSSSLGDDPNVIPNVKAVYDYINNTIGAADITGVSASLGLFGGGAAGYVSLSLDTASVHFTDSINTIINDLNIHSGSYVGTVTTSNIDEGSNLYWTVDRFITASNDYGLISGSGQLTNQSSNYIPYLSSSGIFADSGFQYTRTEFGPQVFHSTQIEGDLIPFNTIYGNNIGTPGGFEFSNVYAINLHGNLIGEVSASNGVISSSLQLPDGLVSSSTQVIQFLPTGIVSGSTQLTENVSTAEIIIKNSDGTLTGSNSYADVSNLAVGTSTPTNLGSEQITINGTQIAGVSGILSFTENDVVESYDYVNNNVRFIDTNAGTSIAIKPDADPTKAWVFDLEGDLVSGGGSGNVGAIYASRAQFNNELTASDALITDDITATNFIGNFVGTIQAENNIVSSSIQVTNFLPSGVISGSTQLPTGIVSGSSQIDVEQTTNYNQVVNISGTQTIGGTKTFNDIVVNGTGSFAYFVSTESELNIIGQSFIVLNNDTPTERYAGLAVYDSGSAGVTASLQFDGQTNDWFYEYSDDGGVTTDHGVVMFGPEFSTKGAPTYNTNNTILKSNGGHHTLDSNITDDGSTITLGSNTNVTGVLSATTFAGVISGSSQVNADTITNFDSNVLTYNNSLGVISGSSQVNLTSAVGYTSLLRSDATDTASGIITFSNTTQSTTNTTGAVIVSGGVGIAKTLNVGEDVVAYASSDKRLKDNILPISNPLQKINSIGGYSFDWNVEKQHIYSGKDYGVIAQEIEEILPELVDTRENGYKAVKYDKLVSLLIEGIKELSQEVSELKKQINK